MNRFFLLAALVAMAQCTVEEISITNFKAGFLNKDEQATGANLKTIAVHSKSSGVINGEPIQRLYVNFNIQKKADGSKIVPQQVFISLEHAATGEDLVFVVDPSANGYVLDINLKTQVKVFNNLSGAFKASLIVGGANVKTPVNWYFADLKFDIPTVPVVVPKSQQVNYETLPEIKHLFRQPEKRPAAVISNAFTLICLSPLAILFIAWLKIGINYKSLPVSLWVPIFHIGLAGIFALYFVFWLQLNMFETLKYLSVLGFVTFLAGNRVLRAIAEQRKEKTA